MSALRAAHAVVASIADVVSPPRAVFAHCDIPCGIYDPHEAQISALTVLRMTQLIGELPKPSASSKPEEWEMYSAKLARYVAVKESHAERVKAELRILWGDYFTMDHQKQFPTLSESFWKALKAASKARTSTASADAQELLNQVHGIAEMFWKSKGAQSHKVPSMQKSGGEIVYPIPS